MAIKSTPEQAAEDWANRLAASGDKITRGVNAVTVAPSAKAVQKKAKMIQAWTDAMTSGKWERNTAAVTLEDWRTQMTTKGIPRIGAGASASKGKQADFYRKLFPYINNVVAQANNMGDVTLEERLQKAVFVMREMSKFNG